MCRLFFMLYKNNTETTEYKTKLKEKYINIFIQQSYKNDATPKYHFYENDNHLDGFGFSWLSPSTKKWNIHKSENHVFHSETKLHSFMDDILSSHLIFGHLRHKIYGEQTIDNTQPFLYKNNIFIHNGFIKNFDLYKTNIISHINHKYISCIKGETDSEVLFYLFLSIKDDISKDKKLNEKEILEQSLSQLIDILKSVHIKYALLNFIYSNQKYVLISRYIICSPNIKKNVKKPLSLFYNFNIKKGLFTVSTKPIKKSDILIDENTTIIQELPII